MQQNPVLIQNWDLRIEEIDWHKTAEKCQIVLYHSLQLSCISIWQIQVLVNTSLRNLLSGCESLFWVLFYNDLRPGTCKSCKKRIKFCLKDTNEHWVVNTKEKRFRENSVSLFQVKKDDRNSVNPVGLLKFCWNYICNRFFEWSYKFLRIG